MIGCLKRPAVREVIDPNVVVEPIHEPPSPTASEKRERIASCSGKINKLLTYTLPPNKEYVRYEIAQDPKGSYNVYSEQLTSGTDLHIQEQRRESHQANRAIGANVEMLGAGAAGIQAGHQLASSDRIGHITDMQTAKATIRITVVGGKNGCGCMCPPSTLEVWIVTKKREAQSLDLALREEGLQRQGAEPQQTRKSRYMDYQAKQAASRPQRRIEEKRVPFR